VLQLEKSTPVVILLSIQSVQIVFRDLVHSSPFLRNLVGGWQESQERHDSRSADK
jgi:hypothetical protein